MKAALDLPDDLYLAAKTQTAAQNRKIKDFVAQGLEPRLTNPAGPQT